MILFMSKIRFPVAVSSEDHAQLEQWESAHGTPQQVALRCRILLGAIDGQKNQAIANRLNVSRPTVNLWRKRARDLGIGQVWEIAPGRGRPSLSGCDHQRDPAGETKGGDALELSLNGQGEEHQQRYRESVVANAQPQAPSEPNIQTFTRHKILGKNVGCGGPLFESAAEGIGAVFG